MRAWSRVKRNKAAVFGLMVLGLVCTAALLAPWIAPYDPAEQFFDGLTVEGRPLGPSQRFLLGRDLLGRDLRRARSGDVELGLVLQPNGREDDRGSRCTGAVFAGVRA